MPIMRDKQGQKWDIPPNEVAQAQAKGLMPVDRIEPPPPLGRGLPIPDIFRQAAQEHPDIASRLVSTVPAYTTLGGGLLGLPGGPGIAAASGMAGAGAGRLIERGLRGSLGLPQPQSLTGAVFGLPPALEQPVDVAEQMAVGGLMEMGPAVGAGLRGLSGMRRQVMRREGEKKAAGIMKESDITPEVMAAEAKAKQARQAAGAAKGKLVRGTPGEITAGELADHIIAQRSEIPGAVPIQKAQLIKQIKRERARLLSDYTGGARIGNELAETFEQADYTKRALQDALRGRFNQASNRPMNPGLRAQMERAYRDLLEQKVAGLPEANVAAQQAIRTHQDVARLAKNVRSEPVRELQKLRNIRAAGAAAAAPGRGLRVGLSGGFTGPMRGYPDPGKLADFLDMMASIATHPATRGTASGANLAARFLFPPEAEE